MNEEDIIKLNSENENRNAEEIMQDEITKNKNPIKRFMWNDLSTDIEFNFGLFEINPYPKIEYIIKFDISKGFIKKRNRTGFYYYITNLEFIKDLKEHYNKYNKENDTEYQEMGNEILQFAKGTGNAIKDAIRKYDGFGIVTIKLKRINACRTEAKVINYEANI